MGIGNEGSIVFSLRHEHDDWATNSNSYHFGRISHPGIDVEMTKHADRTLD